MNQNRYSLTCRTAEAQQVMSWDKAGQSGYVLGLRGAGKSNFLRSLLRHDTQHRYLEQTWADFLFVLVDLLSLIERTEWAACKLILNRAGPVRDRGRKRGTCASRKARGRGRAGYFSDRAEPDLTFEGVERAGCAGEACYWRVYTQGETHGTGALSHHLPRC